MAAGGWEGCRREKVNTSFTFNTLINGLLTIFFPPATSHGGLALLGSSQESRLVQLCEKTSDAVSGGQSTFAQNPFLLFLLLFDC